MSEYIDREAAINVVVNNPYRIASKTGKTIQEIKEIPTAEVVPKSDVEKWKEINKQLHKEMSERMIEERKIERKLVAREIFEEIEELAKIYTFPVVKNGVVEIAKEPFWCIEPNDLAELKNKYTENGL